MNLYLRLLRVWLANLPAPVHHFSHTTESRFRVLPHDLDAFGHMNNGRYFQIMDVARTEWMLQTGVAAAICRHRWSPVLGGGAIRYRHSLGFLQAYRVCTRLLGWDNRWFFFEHAFVDKAGRSAAVGVTRAALRKNNAWVHADAVADCVDPEAVSPPVPAHVREWIDLEERIYRDSGTVAAERSCAAGQGTVA